MYTIIFISLAVTLVSGYHLDQQLKALDGELQELVWKLQELSENKNDVEEKGQLSNILSTTINAVGTPPLVVGQLIQTNIAHATQIYNDLLTEIIQFAPNAGIAPPGLKPPSMPTLPNSPAPTTVKELFDNLKKITTSFMGATRVAKDVIDDYVAELKA